LVKRLLIHCADAFETLFKEIFHQVPADEAAGAGDNDKAVLV